MTSKLALYNMALRHLGETRLSSLSEAREPRLILDDFYDHCTGYCLGRASWNFAMRAVSMTASATITPEFGYTYAFEKPSDWVKTYQVSSEPTFKWPLQEYNDEAAVLYANATPLYFKYVSNDTSYGMNLSNWPENFTYFVSQHLAALSWAISKDKDLRDALKKEAKRSCAVAASSDATDEPPQSPPPGSWATSRGPGRSRDQMRSNS